MQVARLAVPPLAEKEALYADYPLVRDGGCREPARLWSLSNEVRFSQKKWPFDFAQSLRKSMRGCGTPGRERHDDARSEP
jgi:hypothetical protein